MTGPLDASVVRGLAQPDQRSCGAATLVAARMLVDPAYAAPLGLANRPDRGGFAEEALAIHRKVTGFRDAQGRFQLPWPRALGTPPWAVARQMSALSAPGQPAVDYDWHLVLGKRERLVARMMTATAAGRPVPFYVGSRWLPRHVVLAVAPADDGLVVYNPAGGRVLTMNTGDFVSGELHLGRWRKPWFVVLPDEG